MFTSQIKYINKHPICPGSHSCFQICKSYHNPSRFSKVMITNVLPPFYGSQCINCMSAYLDVRRVWTCWSTNGVPAEPKREMALRRHMRVSRPSGLSAGQCWLLTLMIAETHRHRKMSTSYSKWIRQTTPFDSPWTLVFLCQKSW